MGMKEKIGRESSPIQNKGKKEGATKIALGSPPGLKEEYGEKEAHVGNF